MPINNPVTAATAGLGLPRESRRKKIGMIAGQTLPIDERSAGRIHFIKTMPINNPVTAATAGLGLPRESRRKKIGMIAGQTLPIEWEMGEVALVYQVETSAPARVRLYRSQESMNADATRPLTLEPLPGGGLLLEVVTTIDRLVIDLSPVVWTVKEGEIYYGLLTNRGETVTDLEVSLHFIG